MAFKRAIDDSVVYDRFLTKMLRKRARCSLNSVLNSTLKTWLMNWFRTSRCDCFISKSRTLFWQTTSIVHPKRQFCWLHMLFKPSMAIMTKISTPQAIWPTTDFCLSGMFVFHRDFRRNMKKKKERKGKTEGRKKNSHVSCSFQQSHGPTQSDAGTVGRAHIYVACWTPWNAQV